MSFSLSQRSLRTLAGVHGDLIKVVTRAAELAPDGVEFVVTEGVRTAMRQSELFKAGATRTMKSRHLDGHAVDLAALVAGEVRWDWPLYSRLAELMKEAAHELAVDLEWGGDWTTFKDGPHFQLTWSKYPS